MRNATVAAILLMVTSTVQALSYIGPPTTVMKAGQWGFGGMYTDSKQDIELKSFGVLDDVELDTTLATATVGLADHRAELFGRVGVGQYDWFGDDREDELCLGFGGRITTNKGHGNLEDLDWGLALHLTYHEIPEKVGEGELYEFQLGLGPCWRPGIFLLYGGPMVHMLGGELDLPLVGEFDIRQESSYGGYIGGGIDVGGFQVTGEVQATPDATGWAVGGRFEF